MASKAATWAAFGSIIKRGLTTHTPTRHCPRSHQGSFLPPHQAQKGRKLPKNHFTSNSVLSQEDASSKDDAEKHDKVNPAKRKGAKTQTSRTSLRRVAAEAQRSTQVIQGRGRRAHVDPGIETKDVTAYCAAEQYNLHIARDVLSKEGYAPDPYHTDLFPQVLHIQTPKDTAAHPEETLQGPGDVFIFPSGCVVTWNVPETLATTLVQRTLLAAAINSHANAAIEVEDLEYIQDPTREHSKIVGETIVLGTKATSSSPPEQTSPETSASTSTTPEDSINPQIPTTLTKIAFSSALARSTKLAVLENMLHAYFLSTRRIPSTLSVGASLPFTRRFILQKTGELLTIRAQLNLYSELTDALPDLFWDSPHSLGLEDYYEKVGKALDVDVRIRVLNERMDYASEIAAVLRERLSEKHSTELEWLIIVLIAIEVGFEVRRLWREWVESGDVEAAERLLREYLKRELGRE
ncbi:DUF155-domain-containing protein [Teratosphaeria nubilosa]|uniref:DUF155-domain-containing protein n=1 Tax=Teratosphaeria nubilosa TaxID=161662 RepID=A0A6G1LNC8_9PEZI|nr:DUF155-domain-containing protein [Teratosphaeria nubilosa]